jgi:hypothetical protein
MVLKSFLLSSLLLFTPLASADSDDFSMDGYISQTWLKSTANKFEGSTKSGSFDLYEVGINTSYRSYCQRGTRRTSSG